MAGKVNAPKLRGTASGKPRGNGATVPAGQYPTVLATRGVPALVRPNLDALTGGKGTTTVNSTPSN